jgi:Rrf2 family cysteine metabolism transcriptional repressor
MKITKKSEYALRALVQIALSDSGEVIRARDIARRENFSIKFLGQILALLRQRGIVETRRGVGGGYVLNKPSTSITLADVIRIVDGPLAPVSCVSEMAYTPCGMNENLCALKSIMSEVRMSILGVLERVTLADLCQRAIELKAAHEKK